MTAKIDSDQFLSGANEILGGKIANSPELTNKVEIQKTIQLQEQLSLYTQLEQKRQSIAAQAKKELETGNGITQQTREQSSVQGYKEYLEMMYGDYMQLPPEDKRHPQHTFTAYKKD